MTAFQTQHTSRTQQQDTTMFANLAVKISAADPCDSAGLAADSITTITAPISYISD